MIVTAITASLLGAMLMKLSSGVIALRRKNKVGLGTGGVEELERAIRAHGNFSEYVPIILILLGALELNGAPWWILVIPAALIVVGRFLHARGMHTPPPNFSDRVRGMMLTFASLVTLVALNLIWVALKFIA